MSGQEAGWQAPLVEVRLRDEDRRAVQSTSQLTDRLVSVAVAVTSQGPTWLLPIRLGAAALGLLAQRLPRDPAALAVEAAALQQELRRRQGHEADAADRLLDRVIAEVDALDRVPEVSRAVGQLASEILAGDAEKLTGHLLARLDSGELRSAIELRDGLAEWVGARLEPALGDDAQQLGLRLGDHLLAVLWEERGFQELVAGWDKESAAAFRQQALELLGSLHDRLAILDALLAEGRQVRDEVGKLHSEAAAVRLALDALAGRLGRPTAVRLAQLAKSARPLAAELAFRELRHRLCSPLDEAEIGALLARAGLDAAPGARSVPPLFDYLPHRLAECPASPEGRLEGPAEWPELKLEMLVDDLASGEPQRVLLLAPAGFGKSTFLGDLALRLLDRQVLCLPPVAVRQLPNALSIGGLLRWHADCFHPTGWESAAKGRLVALEGLAARGELVLLVDGVDQVAGALEGLDRALAADHGPLRLVATCRQELDPHRKVASFDRVVALRAPEISAASPAELPPAVRDHLAATFGQGDDQRQQGHPFFLHVARLLHHGGRLPDRAAGSHGLLAAYLDELLRLGVEHREGSAEELREAASRSALEAQKRVYATLALDSLRFTLAGQTPSLQELPRRLYNLTVPGLARRLELPSDAVEQALRRGERHAALLAPVAEASSYGGEPIWVFHHQLLQELLAAQALAEEVVVAFDERGHRAAVRRLADLVGDVVRPRRLRRGARALDGRGGPLPGDEVLERVRGLELWSYLAAELVARLEPEQRARLVQRLLPRLLAATPADKVPGDAARSALLRLRDELLAHDRELAQWAAERAQELLGEEASRDPVVTQLADDPDPFTLLGWRLERRLIVRQVRSTASWLRDHAGALLAEIGVADRTLDRQLQALLCRAGEAWEVRPVGPTLGAFQGRETEPRWLLVPAGSFVAGDVEWDDELPVRAEQQVAGPFWVARHPVSVAEYRDFLRARAATAEEAEGKDLRYDLRRSWWRPVRQAARGVLETEKRRAPWGWPAQLAGLRQPVTGVSWFEAVAYTLWRNTRAGFEPVGGLHRLPSKGEWGKAARGLLGRRWPWGCVWRPELVVCREEGALPREIAPVDVLAMNLSPFGARGMAGNVWEWTASAWNEGRFGETIGAERLGEIRANTPLVWRGGSFSVDRLFVRCAVRYRVEAGGGYVAGGFRCVRDVL